MNRQVLQSYNFLIIAGMGLMGGGLFAGDYMLAGCGLMLVIIGFVGRFRH